MVDSLAGYIADVAELVEREVTLIAQCCHCSG